MEMISTEEKKKIEDKIKELEGKRPTISNRIAEARALGDLKENAEYHAARDEQGMNEAEIRRLEEKLRNAQVVDDSVVPDDMVFIGSVVTLKEVKTGKESKYRIVGESTGNLGGEILEVTSSSPLGEALIKCRIGETVSVSLRRGTKRFEIIAIA